MDTPQCDAIVVSAMAWMDGETAPIDRAEIDATFSPAATVRRRSKRFVRLRRGSRPSAVRRSPPMCGRRSKRNSTGPRAIPAGLVLTAGSVFLLAWRALEAATMDPLTLWTRPVTVGVAVLVFLCLRVNPFRVEPRLV